MVCNTLATTVASTSGGGVGVGVGVTATVTVCEQPKIASNTAVITLAKGNLFSISGISLA